MADTLNTNRSNVHCAPSKKYLDVGILQIAARVPFENSTRKNKMADKKHQVSSKNLHAIVYDPVGTMHYTCGTGGIALQQYNMGKYDYSAYFDSRYSIQHTF